VIFPDANHASPAAVEDPIGVPERIHSGVGWSRRDRARRPARILTIEPLIDIVREIDRTIVDCERAAAILVRARANAENVGVVGRHAFWLPVRADPVDKGSSLLLRLGLGPIDCVAVERDLLEPDRVGDDEVGSYGRRPKAIGAGGHAFIPSSIPPKLHEASRGASESLWRSMTANS
jgi:hypothetical protein